MNYDYSCSKCGFQEEKSHSMKENPIFKCPECGAKMKRLLNGGGNIIFKGVGWPRKGTGLTPKATVTTEVGIKIPKVMKNIVHK
jgi:putative FmdB family regulatory protein